MPAQREVDEATISQQVEKIVEGIRTRDLKGLKQLYAADVVSFDVEPPLQHVGIEAKLKNWAKVFTFFQDVTYEVRDLTLTVGDEVAYGHCFGRLSGMLKNGSVAELCGIPRIVPCPFQSLKNALPWIVAALVLYELGDLSSSHV